MPNHTERRLKGRTETNSNNLETIEIEEEKGAKKCMQEDMLWDWRRKKK